MCCCGQQRTFLRAVAQPYAGSRPRLAALRGARPLGRHGSRDGMRRHARGRPAARSFARSARLRGTPQRYPVRSPSLPTTRWQGTASETWFCAQARATARTARGAPIERRHLAIGARFAERDALQRFPDPPLEGGAPQVERQGQRRPRLLDEADHVAHRLGQILPGRLDPRRREAAPEIALQRLRILGEADEAHAALRRAHEERPQRALGQGGADDLARTAAPRRARRHAEHLPRRPVDPALAAVASAGDRIHHPLAVGQQACNRRARTNSAKERGVTPVMSRNMRRKWCRA